MILQTENSVNLTYFTGCMGNRRKCLYSCAASWTSQSTGCCEQIQCCGEPWT